jgi:recombination protein RecA
MATKKKATSASGGTFASKYKNLLIDPADIASKAGVYTTGSPRIDKLLGGGLPKGKLSEFYGKPGSGKSTLAMAAAGKVMAESGRVLYVDLEGGLDIRPEGKTSWLTTNGIDVYSNLFDLVQGGKDAPISGEEVYNMILDSVRTKEHQFIIVDSMAALTTASELAGEIGDSHFGAVAKLNSQSLRVLQQLQNANRECHIVFINQVRDQIAGGMGGLKSTGGRAVEHYMGMKVRFDKGLRVHTPDGDVLTPIRVRVEKSRFGPAKEANITISSRRGIDVLTEVYEGAVEAGYVHKDGSWYTLYNRPILDSLHAANDPRDIQGYVTRAQGDSKIKNAIAADPKLYEVIYEAAVGTAEVAVVEDAE